MDVKTYQYINLEYMDMMSDGDDSMKAVMLEMLVEELPQEITKMEGLLASQDWNELSAVSHKMKSTLAFVGNDDMTAANKQIERICKSSEDKEQLNPMLASLTRLCPLALKELQQELSNL